MKKEFVMNNNSLLSYKKSNKRANTTLNHSLHLSLRKKAIEECFKFCASFFNMQYPHSIDFDEIVKKYENDVNEALSMGLLKKGGIPIKDYLIFWCLGYFFKPETYIESGVFIGSSLHALIKSSNLKEGIAIDPNLNKLKIPNTDLKNIKLIQENDFSELKIDFNKEKTLVFFDDHINTANRIIQSSNLGVKYIIFDDSIGFEGICQRKYPAVPTIPMIQNYDIFNPGDKISWDSGGLKTVGLNIKILKQILFGRNTLRTTRVELELTEEIIDYCKKAYTKIKKIAELPDLGTFIPQLYPSASYDIRKYIVELN